MTTGNRMEGEFQLCDRPQGMHFSALTESLKQLNGQIYIYKRMDTSVVHVQQHWETFINEEDFSYISSQGLNAVRIPVAWWMDHRARRLTRGHQLPFSFLFGLPRDARQGIRLGRVSMHVCTIIFVHLSLPLCDA